MQALDLDDEAAEAVLEQIEARGIELKDDCGRESAAATYVNGDLASSTTDALQLFLNEAGRHPLLTAEQEVELAKRIERGDQDANLPAWSTRTYGSSSRSPSAYQGHDLSLLDLIQEGIIGLIRAVESSTGGAASTFRPTRPAGSAVVHAARQHPPHDRTPVHIVEREQRIGRAERELVGKLGREPTDKELAKATRLPRGRSAEVRRGPPRWSRVSTAARRRRAARSAT